MKKIWRENRILFVLFVILIVCFIAISSVTISYFVGSHKSVYGERLDNKVEISKDVKKDYIELLESDEKIAKASFRVSVRTIYIEIVASESATLDDLKEKASLSIEKIPQDVTSYYDLNFILVKDGSDEFTLMGLKNRNSDYISWNNNTVSLED